MAHRADARGVSLGAGCRICAISKSSTPSSDRCRSRASRSSRWRRRANRARSLPVLELPASAKKHPSDLRLVIDRDAAGPPAPHRCGREIVRLRRPRRRLAARRERPRSRDRPSGAVVARARVRHRRALRHRRQRRSAKLAQRRHRDRAGARTTGCASWNAARFRSPACARNICACAASTTAPPSSACALTRTQSSARARCRTAHGSGCRGEDRFPATKPQPAGIARFDYALARSVAGRDRRASSSPATTRSRRSACLRAHSDDASAPWIRRRQSDGVSPAPGRRNAAQRRHRHARRMQRLARVSHRVGDDDRRAAAPYARAIGPTALRFSPKAAVRICLPPAAQSARHADYPIEPALASLRASLGKDWQPPVAQDRHCASRAVATSRCARRRRPCRGGAGCCGLILVGWRAARLRGLALEPLARHRSLRNKRFARESGDHASRLRRRAS